MPNVMGPMSAIVCGMVANYGYFANKMTESGDMISTGSMEMCLHPLLKTIHLPSHPRETYDVYPSLPSKRSIISIVAITETRLTNTVLDGEILPSNFMILRRDRCDTVPDKRGGGVLLAINEALPSKSPCEVHLIENSLPKVTITNSAVKCLKGSGKLDEKAVGNMQQLSLCRKNKIAKEKMKRDTNSSRQSRSQDIARGDSVLVQQRRTSKVDAPFAMEPLIVTATKRAMITARSNNGQQTTRNATNFRKLPHDTQLPDPGDEYTSDENFDSTNLDHEPPAVDADPQPPVTTPRPERPHRHTGHPQRLIEEM
ncbi:hypothetical protein CAPTEDRAFT_202328 [Capitella teleta]|uniref:Uncharacterized protein n=1 Tax=Capitella teleta TaxID=283909 RepID=R7UY21_CAPTE|nr:hypothetical protein CAPTEDRAFT_202328 [Capitella teleta]|eukprot:ELU11184.1 hypothetical protein CAPTEDRAFT_202328 [Capitella teleta]